MMMVSELMKASKDRRMEFKGSTADLYVSSVMPENRVLKSLDELLSRCTPYTREREYGHYLYSGIQSYELVEDFLASRINDGNSCHGHPSCRVYHLTIEGDNIESGVA